MFPPASPADYFAQSSLGRLAHSALPGAPVRPHVARGARMRSRAVRIVRPLRSRRV
ncbi:MAG TPA: hypothetical protein VIR58_06820 [Acidimicrobiales bacterium]